MPVHEEDGDEVDEAEVEILREGSRLALRTAILWSIVEAGVVVAGVVAARPVFAASHSLLKEGASASYWQEATMPAVLFALCGGALGILLGWRVVSASGLTGQRAWLWALMSWMFVMAGGVVAAVLSFGGNPPAIFWVAWVMMSIAGATGLSVHTLWMG